MEQPSENINPFNFKCSGDSCHTVISATPGSGMSIPQELVDASGNVIIDVGPAHRGFLSLLADSQKASNLRKHESAAKESP